MQACLALDSENSVYDPKQQRAILRTVAGSEYDFEWYPTTQEMLVPVLDDMLDGVVESSIESDTSNFLQRYSMLDICAGSGTVFSIMQKLWDEKYKSISHIVCADSYKELFSSKFAIEKSIPLIESMDKDIAILGTELMDGTLIDKSGFEYAFMNPPYSQFELMTSKVVRELRCKTLYLVIPTRWDNSKEIQEAISLRKADVEVLGEFDFQDAEIRKARAKVNVLKVTLGRKRNSYSNDVFYKVDPFDAWLDEVFPIFSHNDAGYSSSDKEEKKTFHDKVQHQVVAGKNLIEVLEELYKKEMDVLKKNYQSINDLSPALLFEMNVNVDSLKSSFKSRIKGLKNKYWKELFSNYDKITKRLTSSKRTQLLDTLASRTNIDYTVQNALAVTIWVLKQAAGDMDEQLLEVYGSMVNELSIVNYKSNKRVINSSEWGWNRKPENLTHYSLSYRFVLENKGSLFSGASYYEQEHYAGLSEHTYNFISDVLVIARNLGFEAIQSINDFEWTGGKPHRFTYFDTKGKEQLICEFKPHKNGNNHVRIGKTFGVALNVEHGRLQGWVASAHSASTEMGVDLDLASNYFNCNFDVKQIKAEQFLLTSL